jgi:hypothetical protein
VSQHASPDLTTQWLDGSLAKEIGDQPLIHHGKVLILVNNYAKLAFGAGAFIRQSSKS